MDYKKSKAPVNTVTRNIMDLYPDGEDRATAQQKLFELQDKLVQKELYSAQLYYDLGQYFATAHTAATITRLASSPPRTP